MTSSGYYGEVNLIYSKPKPNKVKIGQLWWHKDMTFSPPYHVSVTKKEHGHLVCCFLEKTIYDTQSCSELLTDPNWFFIGIDAAKHNSEN